MGKYLEFSLLWIVHLVGVLWPLLLYGGQNSLGVGAQFCIVDNVAFDARSAALLCALGWHLWIVRVAAA
jgi:hypothetical protein